MTVNGRRGSDMAKLTYTDGTVVITIDNCKCGFTGGCDLCRPYSYKMTGTYWGNDGRYFELYRPNYPVGWGSGQFNRGFCSGN